MAVWTRNNGSNFIVQTASATISPVTASWGAAVDISTTGQDASFPQIALSSDGSKASAVWTRSNGSNSIIQTASATITGGAASWGAAVDLSATGQDAYFPQIALSSDGGKASAIWYRNNNGSDGTIQTASAIISVGTTNWGSASDISATGAYVPQIALSSDGTRATAVWVLNVGSYDVIQTSSSTVSGLTASWGAAVNLSTLGQDTFGPLIALSADGAMATAIWRAYIGNTSIIQSSSATIVSASVSPPSQTINGSVGTPIPPTTALTASGFTGTVTYSVSPSLPANLSLNTSSGIISGTPTATQPLTQYTITATGSTSGAATATVSIIISTGPPVVSNLVATPGAGFILLNFSTTTTSIAAFAPQAWTNSVITYTGTCVSTNGGVTASSTGTSSPLRVTGVTAGKTYTCSVTGTDGSGSSTSEPSNAVVPAPAPTPPNPIPALSEWAQILMMLALISVGGLYGWKINRR